MSDEPKTACGSASDPSSTQVSAWTSASTERILPSISGFDLVGELGRGGMGVVYLARRHLLNRPCALKMILAGEHASSEASIRFMAEAEAVARLHHANIIQIYGIGTSNGHPYLELEFAEGGSLEKVLEGTPWAPRRAARLVEPLARAVAEAHRMGIIHRDLKPGNVLLMGDGTPKIGDFGLAKSLESASGVTRTDSILGSPSYMAPEQAEARHSEIGQPVDVYSLGAILYELLTGRPPFRGETVFQTIEQVKNTEPVRPARLVPGLPRDIETICLKCLEKAASRRYLSALDLANDLKRFLDGEPVKARPVRAWERTVKWARRRPAIAALFVAIHILLAALLALGVWSYMRINQALDVARTEQSRAIEASERSQKLAEREAATRAASNRMSAGLALSRGLDLSTDGKADKGALWMIEALRVVSDDPDSSALRRASRLNLASWRAGLVVPLAVLPHPSAVNSFALVPGGQRLLTACGDGSVRTWNLATGQSEGASFDVEYPLVSLSMSPTGAALVAAGDGGTSLWNPATGTRLAPAIAHPRRSIARFLPNGRAFLDKCEDGTAQVRSAETGEPIGRRLGNGSDILSEAISFDGSKILLGLGDNTAVLYDSATGEPLVPPLSHEWKVSAVSFSPDGRRFATATGDYSRDLMGTLRVYETGKTEPLFAVPTSRVGCVSAAYRPDGRVLCTGGYQGLLQLWDAETGQPIGTPIRHTEWARCVAFSPDSLLGVSGDGGGLFRLWNAATGEPIGQMLEHGSTATTCGFSPDGRKLFTCSSDGTARVYAVPWRSSQGRPGAHRQGAATVEISPDGKLIATASTDGTARLFEAESGRPVGPPLLHQGTVRAARFSPDGKTLATAGDNGAVLLWDVATGRSIGRPMEMGHWVINLRFSPDGRTLLAGRVEGNARLWDVGTTSPIGPMIAHPSQAPGHELWCIDFSRDGKVAITGSREGTLGFWDAGTGNRLGEFLRFGSQVTQLVVHPDGKRIFVAEGSRIHVIDLTTHKEIGTPFYHNIRSMVLSPDGRSVLIGAWDRTARLIDAGTGELSGSVMEHSGEVKAVAFSPDGTMLLTGTKEGEVRFWDAATCRPVGPPLSHGAELGKPQDDDRMPVAFHPSGRFAISVGGHMKWWSVPRETQVDDMRLLAEAQSRSGLEIDAHGGLRTLGAQRWHDRLRESNAGAGHTSELPAAEWHDLVAAQCERDGPAASALWHLDQLIRAQPENWYAFARRSRVRERNGDLTGADQDEVRALALGPRDAVRSWISHDACDLAIAAETASQWPVVAEQLDRLDAIIHGDPILRLRRGQANARRHRWAEASADLAAYVSTGRVYLTYIEQYALLLLRAGDDAGFRRFCLKRLDRARVDRRPIITSILTSLIVSGPGGLDHYDELLGIVDNARSSSAEARKELGPGLRGALLYRAGRHAEAIPLLEESLHQSNGKGSATDWGFLAMAQERAGRHEDAVRSVASMSHLNHGDMPDQFWDDLQFEILHREVQAVVVHDHAFPADPFAP